MKIRSGSKQTHLGLWLPKGLVSSNTPFDPRSITGLISWHDFSDAATLYTDAGSTRVTANNDLIYQANDKSGTGNHLIQATAGNRPAYKTGVKNGLSVSRYDGVGTSLATAGTLAIDTSTIFLVQSTDSTGAQWNQVPLSVAGPGDGLAVQVDQLYPNVANTNFAGVYLKIDSFGTSSLALDYNADTYTGYLDGALVAANAGATTYSAHVLTLGRWSARIMKGDIAEVLVYNRVLAAAEHNRVGAYLANKWALTAWTQI